MHSVKHRNQRGFIFGSLPIAAMCGGLVLAVLVFAAAGCGTGIYQDFTNAISGCCCDDDDCDDCDDCGGWYYDDCYYGDCYYDDCYYGDCY